MKTIRLLSLLLPLLLALPAFAQVPDTLIHSIPPPPVGAGGGAKLGSSVAVDGGYAVAGAPEDATGEYRSGVVKVFDSTTGALLHVLANPTPAYNDRFGTVVAISGTRVVVGAHLDDTGASDAGSAYVYDLSSGTPTVPIATLNNPAPAVNDFFGESVAISGTRVVVGAYADESGGAYVYDLASGTPTVPVVTLNNPSVAFGTSVAISGTRVVIGATHDDTGADDAGSTYVYDLSSGTPTVPVATLNNPSPGVDDFFGESVAISGTRVVVGTPYDDYAGVNSSGSVYVYDLSSSTPTVPVATLNKLAPAEREFFGHAVAISGTRVVVGAPYDGFGTFDEGNVYVYDLSSGTPTVPVATLNNPAYGIEPNFGQHGYFGTSVAISSTRVMGGAPENVPEGGGFDGIAYVYDLSGGTPTVPVATLIHSSPSPGDGFGASVAISGTLMVVGGSGSAFPGSAYVYDLASATPAVPVVTLNSPNLGVLDYFGTSVAISGTRVVVGAVGAYGEGVSGGASYVGASYVYDLASATPAVPVVTLNNPTPADGDFFGGSVAIFGTRVVVGAAGEDTGAESAGSVYVYDLNSGTPTVPIVTLNNPSPELFDYFGQTVAISGTRVVVGAVDDDTGASDAGSAYVYDLSSGTPTVPVATLNNPSPAASDFFAGSVAISGTRVVVGAAYDDTGATNAGSAYVYDVSSGTPTVPVATLTNPSPAVDDYYGGSVAISGTRVMVGAGGDDTGAFNAGSAYMYDLASTTPTVPVAALNNPSPAAVHDAFGGSVAIDGGVAVIGAPADDTVAADKGYAHVFGDTVTRTPVLAGPAANATIGSPITITFTLPEAALRGSVKLSFGATELTLAASQEIPGLRSLTFNPANPTASPQIASGSAISDGSYTVTLSYQDVLGHPAASDSNTNVTLNTVPPAGGTFVVTPASPVTASTPLTGTFAGWADDNLPLTYSVRLGTTVLAAPSTSSTRVFLVPAGIHQVTGRVTDSLGNFSDTTVTVEVTPAVDVVTTVLASKLGSVPRAGASGSGIPAGAVWATFGVPSVNDAGQAAVLASYKVGSVTTTAILGWELVDMAGTLTVVTKKGDAAPGITDVVMGTMKEPLLGPDGSVAWIATLVDLFPEFGNVIRETKSAIFLDADGAGPGVAVRVARTSVDGFPKAFKSVALGANALAYTASFFQEENLDSNTPSFTGSGLWVYDRTTSTMTQALREGDVLLSSTVKTIGALTARTGSAGQGRGLANDGTQDNIVVRVKLVNGTQMLGNIGQDGTVTYTHIGGSSADGYGAEAKWLSFGLPTQNTVSTAMAFVGTVKSGTGTATSLNNVAIFAEDDEDYLAARIVSKGDATGVSDGIFSAFKDPVSASNRRVAFLGTMKRTLTITSADNDGIWHSDDTNGLTLIAREGAQPPEAPLGAQWKAFRSLALPEGGGPLFVATMHSKTAGVSPGPGGITTATDTGLWATDSTGALRLLLQEGDPIGASTVKTFIVLSKVAGSPAQTRSFNSSGSVLVKVTDILGAQHLLHIAVP